MGWEGQEQLQIDNVVLRVAFHIDPSAWIHQGYVPCHKCLPRAS